MPQPWQPGWDPNTHATQDGLTSVPTLADTSAAHVDVSLDVVAMNAARTALNGALPELQKNAAAYFQAYMAALLEGRQPALVPDISIDGKQLNRVAAAAHGWRAFWVGMALAVISALATGFGGVEHIDLLSAQGRTVTLTLAVSSVVGGVVAYLGRLRFTPKYEAELYNATPPGK